MTLLGAILVLASTQAQAQSGSVEHGGVFAMQPMAEGVWLEKVVGDPLAPGKEFVIRIHHDPGYVVLPHTHPGVENITVLSGAWALGTGSRVDMAKLTAMPRGALGVVPPRMAHFGYSPVETILQVHGIGPFVNLPIDPVFELTAKGVMAKLSLLEPSVPTTERVPDCFRLAIGQRVQGARGKGAVAGAFCSPANGFTEYWITKTNGKRYWATLAELKPLR
ncbi:MAG: cupin domain-containing protein [Croceibacterium sp.]